MRNQNTSKVAVITGATSGIGAAIAKSLSRAGYSLVLNAPSSEKLNSLTTELAGPCVAVAGNLRVESTPATLLAAALNNFGRCDVCFNNSGLLEAGTIEAIDIERICNMVRVNVEGAFRVAYTFLQHFVKQGGGHLVNTSSVLGKKVRPTVGAYAATKYAIEALSEALRMELGKTDVRISCIEPGLVRTGLHDRWEVPPAEVVGIDDPLEPEEIARMVLYILEPPAPARMQQQMELPRERELALM
ncbi:MAG TPA: SDR family oxidoreductase [Terracidiphilus sp.]|jgi:NADP-dependent 3-hydroxy acid dehydrogenase YdfG|nr:SDR family oxidoreductase [Terracidiphilus sp.]